MLVETLRADWTARGTNARVRALPEFDDGALTLGAGTKITEARADRRGETTEGERAIALVSVAIGRPLDASGATHVRRALAKAREGDAPLALTHLALAGTGRLNEPRDDARRLFIADGLMKAGVPHARSSQRSARRPRQPISTAPTTPASRTCPLATESSAGDGRAAIGKPRGALLLGPRPRPCRWRTPRRREGAKSRPTPRRRRPSPPHPRRLRRHSRFSPVFGTPFLGRITALSRSRLGIEAITSGSAFTKPPPPSRPGCHWSRASGLRKRPRQRR